MEWGAVGGCAFWGDVFCCFFYFVCWSILLIDILTVTHMHGLLGGVEGRGENEFCLWGGLVDNCGYLMERVVVWIVF